MGHIDSDIDDGDVANDIIAAIAGGSRTAPTFAMTAMQAALARHAHQLAQIVACA